MKRFFSCSDVLANTADSVKIEKIGIGFSSFFRGDYWFNSRQKMQLMEILLYPKNPELGVNGEDI